MHNNTEVERIKGGLDIKGSGTFKFHIKDNEGGIHFIMIPNSKYVHDLRVCLLLPHHWVQEARTIILSPREPRWTPTMRR